MSYKKKCFVGPAFDTLDALLDWIDSGFWVFIGSKPFHSSFVSNRILGRVREEINLGKIKACHDGNDKPYVSPNFDKTKIAALVLEINKENQNLDNVPREFFGCIVGHDSINHQFANNAKVGDLCFCGKTRITAQTDNYIEYRGANS